MFERKEKDLDMFEISGLLERVLITFGGISIKRRFNINRNFYGFRSLVFFLFISILSIRYFVICM